MPAPKGNTNAKGNKGGGRKTLYKEEYADQAYKFALLGATEEQISEFFEISHTTLTDWKRKHSSFRVALIEGKHKADAEVAHKLYQRAIGYEHEEQVVLMAQKTGEVVVTEVTKHYPPDVTAACKWLHNRQRKLWGAENSFAIDLNKLSEDELDLLINRLILKHETQLQAPGEQER